MSKLILSDVGSLANHESARETINNNFTKIEQTVDLLLSRDGATPNQMTADLDMNSKKAMNMADGIADADGVNIRTARKIAADAGSGDTAIRQDLATGAVGKGAELVAYTPPSTAVLGTVKSFLDSLWSSTGAALINFIQSGTGAVVRTMQAKAREQVTPEDFGAVGDGVTNDTVAVQKALTASLRVNLVNIYKCDPLVLRTGQVVTGTGTLQSTGTGTLITQPVGVTNIILEDFELVGTLLTNEANTLDVGIYLPENGFTLRNLRVRQFAVAGIQLGTNLTPTLGVFERPNNIVNCKITRNGRGINTQSFEYVNISDNLFAENGLNAARTNFAPALNAGAGCAAIVGNLANIAVKGNTVTANAFGISLVGGVSAPNPDHNMISGNTINHNIACGLYIAQPGNYVLINGNTIISNVGDPGAPAVVPIGGVAKDMILIDAHALTFTGNVIGNTDVYGQARCRYIGNNLLYSFVEKSHPDAGSPVTVTWGFTLNSYNLWKGNWFFNFTKPTLWAGGVGNIITDNIENADGLVDGVQKAPAMNADWITPATTGGTYNPARFWRESGNRVRLVGSCERSAGATTTPFTLPTGYRPAGFVDLPCIINGSGSLGMIRIAPSGQVSIFNPTTAAPIAFDVTFTV